MKKFIFPLIFVFTISNSFAQVDPVGAFNKHILANWSGNYYQVSQYKVKGTPYFLGESFWGTIDYKGGKTITGIKVLYDLYNQVAGVDLKNNEIFEAEQGVEQFTIELPEMHGGKNLVFRNADTYGITSYKGYFNVLEDGQNLALLKAYKIQLMADTRHSMDKDVRVFNQYFDYYIFDKKTKQLHKIKLKQKDPVKQLDGQQQLATYAKNNNLTVNREEDLAMLVRMANSDLKH